MGDGESEGGEDSCVDTLVSDTVLSAMEQVMLLGRCHHGITPKILPQNSSSLMTSIVDRHCPL